MKEIIFRIFIGIETVNEAYIYPSDNIDVGSFIKRDVTLLWQADWLNLIAELELLEELNQSDVVSLSFLDVSRML